MRNHNAQLLEQCGRRFVYIVRAGLNTSAHDVRSTQRCSGYACVPILPRRRSSLLAAVLGRTIKKRSCSGCLRRPAVIRSCRGTRTKEKNGRFGRGLQLGWKGARKSICWYNKISLLVPKSRLLLPKGRLFGTKTRLWVIEKTTV